MHTSPEHPQTGPPKYKGRFHFGHQIDRWQRYRWGLGEGRKAKWGEEKCRGQTGFGGEGKVYGGPGAQPLGAASRGRGRPRRMAAPPVRGDGGACAGPHRVADTRSNRGDFYFFEGVDAADAAGFNDRES